MRGDAIELFANIGLGGDHDRFLMQPVGIEAFGRFQQHHDLFGQSCLDGIRMAARCRVRALCEGCDLVQPRCQNLLQRRPLAVSHLDQPLHLMPACSGPLAEILAEDHATWEVRLFAS